MTTVTTPVQPTPNAGTLRGTQSFVGFMSEVWKRPALTGIEISWRWVLWGVFCWIIARRWWPSLSAIAELAEVHNWSPVAWTNAVTISVAPHTGHSVLWRSVSFVCAACLIWIALSAWGRSKVLQRLEPVSKPSLSLLVRVSALRVICFLVILGIWCAAVVLLTQRMVLVPLTLGNEPAFVPFAAIMICGTLSLFVFWMAASYVFQLAIVMSLNHEDFFVLMRNALRSGILRSKLIEINLVIGIVKIALVVLALVFSACPLPFASVATQTFLFYWSVGVGIWWAVASDYMHVVRTTAFLRLWRYYQNSSTGSTTAMESAS